MQRPGSPATFEEGPRKDKGYRRYASNVERALSLFDTALQEWADYIAFLGRLLKALQSRPSNTTEIPHKAVVAKRLAQCLAPMLPSGVHQKTLEVYGYVFSTLGQAGLSRDLPLWLPGLSPALSFASLSVKPTILSIFETFVLVLDPGMLRSALKAILLALLPGLEEETSEEFERTLNLLNNFRRAVSQGLGQSSSPADIAGDQYFWQSLFLASITSSSRRPGALAYMVKELPSLGNVPNDSSDSKPLNSVQKTDGEMKLPLEIEAVTSPEPGLLVRCLAAGLQDDQVLIQRGFLDLLVSHLPLHSAVFRQRVVFKDLELLMLAAASVVIRREMSLNRRLWSWLLGPEPVADKDDSAPQSPSLPNYDAKAASLGSRAVSQTKYFESYGLDYLISGILKMVKNDDLTPATKARPFRICLSLMDRWEISCLLVPRLFLPAMESIWLYQKIAPSNDALNEVLRSASVFFDGVQTSLIWAELTRILARALNPTGPNPTVGNEVTSESSLELVLFVITRFNIREEEMLNLHIPMATLELLINLRFRLETLQASESLNSPHRLMKQAFKIAAHLLDTLSHRFFVSSLYPPEGTTPNSHQMLSDIQRYYKTLQGNFQDDPHPLQDSVIKEGLLHNASQVAICTLDTANVHVAYLEKATDVLEKTLRKTTSLNASKYGRLMSSLILAAERLASSKCNSSFPTVEALVSMLETVKHASSLDVWESDHRVRKILPELLTCLWEYTSPSRPTHNVEAVRCLWRIHRISPDDQLVEGSMATLLFHGEADETNQVVVIEGARRFMTFWAHSNSTTSILTDRRTSTAHTVRKPGEKSATGLSDSLVFERPLFLLLDSLFDQKTELSIFVSGWLQSLSSIQKIVDVVLYHLHTTGFLEPTVSDTTHGSDESDQDIIKTSKKVEECLYYLRTFLNLVQYSTTNMWESLLRPIDLKYITSAREPSGETQLTTSIQHFLIGACINMLRCSLQEQDVIANRISSLQGTSVLLLHQLLTRDASDFLMENALENPLLEALSRSIQKPDLLLQGSLMDLILLVLQRQSLQAPILPIPHRRQTSRETARSTSEVSLFADRDPKDHLSIRTSGPPPQLLDCLILGISSPNCHSILEHWIRFMNECLPFYTVHTSQILIPLVDCFIKIIEKIFQRLRALFEGSEVDVVDHCEHVTTINVLLNGLEYVLARGHDQLLQDEGHAASLKSPEQVQGFFGNMVSGVFASETHKSRMATANDRLTVLLCFKDAVKATFSIWSWGDIWSVVSSRNNSTSASFNYVSLRLRNRTRRILEHLFAAEALECLETLVEMWYKARSTNGISGSTTVLNLLHALEGSKPRNTIPALFNAIYSRTNPNVLDPVRKSSLTSDLSDAGLTIFLVAYTESMEDDALDEIWTDCMTFLRDVLGNPLPHRQTLPTLLRFTAILGQKIDNTNFGEQRKMRKDIGELFVRLLAATFTIKPLGFARDLHATTNGDDGIYGASKGVNTHSPSDPDDVISITASILPNISKILIDTDRIATATTTISTQILTPTLRWKTFPHNVTRSTLEILKGMSRVSEASKIWRKDVAELFNDSRFFFTDSLNLIQEGWMPVLRQWVLIDKDRLADILSRLSSPASAGIMFGVGASSARLEADRKAQLNLRRVALLILAADDDTFVTNLGSLQEKLMDLMSASAASSPSSMTRAEIYMVLRSLVQKSNPVHLASFWPIISTELHEALSSLLPLHSDDKYNITSVLQAAKLLDTLVLIAPDDFQLREWLFITDTIDAVYRLPNWKPTALVDQLAEGLDTKGGTPHSATATSVTVRKGRQPLLTWNAIHDVPKEHIMDRVLRPFLRQLSIISFESTYQMEALDREACSTDLLRDLFDETTLV